MSIVIKSFFVFSMSLLVFVRSVMCDDHSIPKKPPKQKLVAAYGPSAIYFNLFKSILKQAEIPVVYKMDDYGEIRKKFIAGAIDLSCCSAPAWRNRPEERKSQLFSIPFFYATDNYAIRNTINKADFDPKSTKHIFAQVSGWTYASPIYADEIVFVNSVQEALLLVHQGKADYTVINRQEFTSLKVKKSYNVYLGSVFSRIPIHIRVHKKNAAIMPKLNATIKDMKKSMAIARIIAKDIRKPRPSN